MYRVHRFSLFLLCIYIYIYIRTYLGVRYWIDYQTYRHMLSNYWEFKLTVSSSLNVSPMYGPKISRAKKTQPWFCTIQPHMNTMA
jgi:hypothetical protein